MAKNSDPFNYRRPRTLKEAIKAGRKNSASFLAQIDSYLGKRKLNRAERRKFAALLGRRPYAGKRRASDVLAKDELRKQLIFHIDAFQKSKPSRKFFFITLLTDDCNVSKKEPVLFLRRLKGKADKSLRDLGIEGAVAMIEPCFIPSPPDTHAPRYSFHVHALAWADDKFDLGEAKESLEASGSWSNAWGVDPTHMHEITPGKGVAAWWAYYMMKHPNDAKNVVDQGDGTFKLLSTQKGYRGDAVLRLLEGLSQIALQDCFFGVKDGKYIRGPVWRATNNARKLAHPHLRPIKLNTVPKLFKRLWSRSGAHHSKPWRIFD